MLDDWLAQLADVDWVPYPAYDSAVTPLNLPCGPVIWICGSVCGVSRDAWLGLADGIVRLHGDSEKNDCEVSEFCRRLTERPAVVAEKPAQGRLF